MEWIDTITQLVSNLGFPICCVVAMFWQMNEERKTHKEESDKWVEALNRNTSVIEDALDFIRHPTKEK